MDRARPRPPRHQPTSTTTGAAAISTVPPGYASATSTASRTAGAGVQMNVAGDTLTYHHFSNATFTAKVGADGSFKDQQLNQYGGSRSATMQTLSGTIGPGGVSATVTSQYCNFQLTLKGQA